MVRKSPAVLALCLAVLVLGSVANAVMSNAMAVEMALAGNGGAAVGGDCNGCGADGGGDGYSCEFGCIVVLTATTTATASSWPAGTDEPVWTTAPAFVGLVGPPDSSPPKLFT